MGGDYSPPTAAQVYGIDFSSSRAPADGSGLGAVSAPSAAAQRVDNPLHPSNPLVVFGVVAAVTFGLMAFSTSVRVGNSSASLSLGDSK